MSVTPRRRLSNGSALSLNSACKDDLDEEEDDDCEYGARSRRTSKGSAKRRSSFGVGKSPAMNQLNPVEQQRIADMYKTVISLATEDKLTVKNSWNYDLIDQMGKIIKDDHKINFQKASCTLDASVKIYSNRVDDTYNSSHRILECLSRNGNHHDEDDNNDNDNNDGTAKATKSKALVGTKASSRRLNIADTIERNLANINAVTLDNDYAVDPMFHKMSKAFDEGGAKGMLLYNMRVTQKSSTVSFQSKDDSNDPATSTTTTSTTNNNHQTRPPPTLIDITDLLKKLSIKESDLRLRDICPQLEVYRCQMGITDIATDTDAVARSNERYSSGGFADARGPTSTTVSATNGGAFRSNSDGKVAAAHATDAAGAPEADDNYYDMGAGDDYYDDNGDYDQPSFPVQGNGDGDGAAAMQSPKRYSLGGTDKLNWDELVENNPNNPPPTQNDAGDNNNNNNNNADFDGSSRADAEDAAAADTNEALQVLQEGIENLALAGNQDYTFFNAEVLTKDNVWAGAKHWKFASKRRDTVSAALAKISAVEKKTKKGGVGEVDADAIEEEGEEGDGEGEVVVPTAAKSKRGGAKASKITTVLTLELADEADLGLSPAGTADKNMLKNVTESDDAREALLLPPDAKLRVKDLYRLFLSPKTLIPPPHGGDGVSRAALLVGMTARSTSTMYQDLFSEDGGPDMVWGASDVLVPRMVLEGGVLVQTTQPEADKSIRVENMEYNTNYNDGGYEDYDQGDDYYGEGEGDGVDGDGDGTSEGMEGLHIDKRNFVKASRTVEKLEIGYAQVSKRVNIQRLKADIWGEVSSNIIGAVGADAAGSGGRTSSVESAVDGENADPNSGSLGSTLSEGPLKRNRDSLMSDSAKASPHVSENLSFQKMISSVAHKPRQKDVSLPFYFICLLHLANENGLKIEDREDMSDLIISVDSSVAASRSAHA